MEKSQGLDMGDRTDRNNSMRVDLQKISVTDNS